MLSYNLTAINAIRRRGFAGAAAWVECARRSEVTQR
jgi:hypothetical protein